MKRSERTNSHIVLQAMHYTGIVQFSAGLCTSVWA